MAGDISVEPGELPLPPAGSRPGLVYHYAGVAGLKGILEDQCLWASDVWYMNDAREALYGLSSLKRALRDMTAAPGAEEQVQQAALERLADMSDQGDLLHSYIACLSKKRDDLSQWRAYGRPRGFAVGFHRRTLERLYPRVLHYDQPSYREVIYDESVQNRMIADTFRLVLDRSPQIPPGRKPTGIAWLFILESLLLTPSFKDKSFAAEAEVRLQVLHAPTSAIWDDLKFREGSMGLTPYVQIPLKDPGSGTMSAVREIIVGPQPNQAEAIRAAKLLAARQGLNIEVHPSAIPLRS